MSVPPWPAVLLLRVEKVTLSVPLRAKTAPPSPGPALPLVPLPEELEVSVPPAPKAPPIAELAVNVSLVRLTVP